MKNYFKLLTAIFAFSSFVFLTSCEKGAIQEEVSAPVSQTEVIKRFQEHAQSIPQINKDVKANFDEGCYDLNFARGGGKMDSYFGPVRFFVNARNNTNTGFQGTFSLSDAGSKINGVLSYYYLNGGSSVELYGYITKIDNIKVELGYFPIELYLADYGPAGAGDYFDYNIDICKSGARCAVLAEEIGVDDIDIIFGELEDGLSTGDIKIRVKEGDCGIATKG